MRTGLLLTALALLVAIAAATDGQSGADSEPASGSSTRTRTACGMKPRVVMVDRASLPALAVPGPVRCGVCSGVAVSNLSLSPSRPITPPPLIVSACPAVPASSTARLTDLALLIKFVDQLPRPSVAQPVAHCKCCKTPLYHMRMEETTQQLHSSLNATKVYGYGSGTSPVSYPGPSFDVRSGEPIVVQWQNRLPNCHILPVDVSIAGSQPAQYELLATQSRAVPHLHGGNTEPDSDGHPESVRHTPHTTPHSRAPAAAHHANAEQNSRRSRSRSMRDQ